MTSGKQVLWTLCTFQPRLPLPQSILWFQASQRFSTHKCKRIWIIRKRSPKIANYISSQKENTSRRNPKTLTKKESNCWNNLPLPRRWWTLSKLSSTLHSSRPSAALFALCILTDWFPSLKCLCNRLTGDPSFFAHSSLPRKFGMITSFRILTLPSCIPFSWRSKSISWSKSFWSFSNTMWM